jgi:enoyl-CoA hydratase/carnithine racemase
MSDSTTVSYRLEGDVAVIGIDDGKANALSFDLLAEMGSVLDLAGTEAKAIVIAGRPGKFSAGFDLTVMQGGPKGARDLLGRGAELGMRLAEYPMPVVLAVTGHALAMGGILLCCADYRVGADGPYKIGLNEVGIGMPVPRFAVEMCRARLSTHWFNRAIQLGYVHSPTEAMTAGFLDEVVGDDAVVKRAVDMAGQLGGWVHPKAFELTRTNVRGAMLDQVRRDLAEDLAAFTVG